MEFCGILAFDIGIASTGDSTALESDLPRIPDNRPKRIISEYQHAYSRQLPTPLDASPQLHRLRNLGVPDLVTRAPLDDIGRTLSIVSWNTAQVCRRAVGLRLVDHDPAALRGLLRSRLR